MIYNYWSYLFIMAGVTYLIRVIPFVLVKNKIENKYIKSFLYYIPYAVLTVMTIPAVFFATDFVLSAAIGLVVAVIFSLRGAGLTKVAVLACLSVYVTEFVMRFIS